VDGALKAGGTAIGDIVHGLSKTIAVAEDVGRSEGFVSPYFDYAVGGKRSYWRWAEPDSGFGVSGDPLSSMNENTGVPAAGFGFLPGPPPVIGAAVKAINNNKAPFGGGLCSWINGYTDPGTMALNNNCGPNDEIFSFHGNGANVVFMDGHVSYLSESIDSIVMRHLVGAGPGIPPPSEPTPWANQGFADY
jgi:prepilin-type processing-associated H-X9-DG protein